MLKFRILIPDPPRDPKCLEWGRPRDIYTSRRPHIIIIFILNIDFWFLKFEKTITPTTLSSHLKPKTRKAKTNQPWNTLLSVSSSSRRVICMMMSSSRRTICTMNLPPSLWYVELHSFSEAKWMACASA